MNATEKNFAIKNTIATALVDYLKSVNAIQINDFSFAIPVEVDNEARYAEVTITAKSNQDTKTTKAFNPEIKRQEWIDKKNDSVAKKAAKAVEKAKKIERDTEKRRRKVEDVEDAGDE